MRLAQPSRGLVDEWSDALALGGQALGGADGRTRVAGDDRVRKGPGSLLGGVGHHRLEVGDRHLPLRPRPERQPLELVGKPQRALPQPLDQQPRGIGLEPEAALARPRRRAEAPARALGRLVAEHLAAGGLDRLGEPAGRLGLRRHLARDQDHREVGRQGAERGDHGLRLLGRPPLDAVGEQVAPRRHQGHRGDGRDQGGGIGRPLRRPRARSSPEPRDRPRARRGRGAGTAPHRSCPRRCRRSGTRA